MNWVFGHHTGHDTVIIIIIFISVLFVIRIIEYMLQSNAKWNNYNFRSCTRVWWVELKWAAVCAFDYYLRNFVILGDCLPVKLILKYFYLCCYDRFFVISWS